nr:conjugative transfer protein MobI(A/C) [uncultured Halomonas sp.]
MNHVIKFELARTARKIVLGYKYARKYDQENNPNFRFWTHICSMEYGDKNFVIRWRNYSGNSQYSTPISTGEMLDYRLPMNLFKKCTQNERRAIIEAERQFAKIRHVNKHLANIIQSIQAVQEITRMGMSLPKPSYDQTSVDLFGLFTERETGASRDL